MTFRSDKRGQVPVNTLACGGRPSAVPSPSSHNLFISLLLFHPLSHFFSSLRHSHRIVTVPSDALVPRPRARMPPPTSASWMCRCPWFPTSACTSRNSCTPRKSSGPARATWSCACTPSRPTKARAKFPTLSVKAVGVFSWCVTLILSFYYRLLIKQ